MGICGSSQLRHDTRIGKRDFRVERVVGQGGFGVVNAVVKTSAPNAGKIYAMKALRKHVILERNHIEMVFRERNLLARLRHPKLVNMHHAFQDDNHLYIIMDACLGGDLHYQIMQSPSKRFSESQTRYYAACIALALEYMHGQRVLHRDIKPENLLLDARGQLRITDMGVSGEIDEDGNCFSTSGTRPYMAPEVFMSGHRHGRPSDFYSLGITLHQFLTGQRPYRASRPNLKAIVRMAAFVPPDTVKDIKHARRVLASAQERRGPTEEFQLSRRLRGVSPEGIDFVRSLLICNAKYRLGTGGVSELLTHPWIASLDLDAIRDETAAPPFRPDMSRAQCNVYDSDLARLLLSGDDSAPSAPALQPDEQARFEGYDYNTDPANPEEKPPQLPVQPPQSHRTRTDPTLASSIATTAAPGSGVSAASMGKHQPRSARLPGPSTAPSSTLDATGVVSARVAPTGGDVMLGGVLAPVAERGSAEESLPTAERRGRAAAPAAVGARPGDPAAPATGSADASQQGASQRAQALHPGSSGAAAGAAAATQSPTAGSVGLREATHSAGRAGAPSAPEAPEACGGPLGQLPPIAGHGALSASAAASPLGRAGAPAREEDGPSPLPVSVVGPSLSRSSRRGASGRSQRGMDDSSRSDRRPHRVLSAASGMSRNASLAGRAGFESRAGSFISGASSMRGRGLDAKSMPGSVVSMGSFVDRRVAVVDEGGGTDSSSDSARDDAAAAAAAAAHEQQAEGNADTAAAQGGPASVAVGSDVDVTATDHPGEADPRREAGMRQPASPQQRGEVAPRVGAPHGFSELAVLAEAAEQSPSGSDSGLRPSRGQSYVED